MTFFKRGKKSQRKRKAWLSLWYTLVGIAVVTGLIWLLENQRDTDLTDPTAGVTSRFKDSEVAENSKIRFRDVAETMGVLMRHGPGLRSRSLPEDTGSGVACGDYDSDGDWDLYAVNYPGPLGKETPSAGSNRLFRNDGGRFTDVTETAGVGDLEGFGMGASFADYDSDGDVDLYVTNFGPNRLYQNCGDGTFKEVADEAGVADPLWSTGVAWGDFDQDGHLDFYVCNYIDYDAIGFEPEPVVDSSTGMYEAPYTLNPNSFDPQPNRLYRNLGDGTFEETAEICGVSNPNGRSLGATFCDLDGDGWLDLYVNNDVSTNRLYRNMAEDFSDDGPIFFADLSAITGTADPRGSMGLSVGEIGGMIDEPDGLPDLFITHWIAQENAFYQSVLTPGGDLEYRDKTRHFRLGELSIDMVGWGCALTDLDLDGRPDIVVANGSTLELQDNHFDLKAEPIFLLWNDGKMFHNVASVAGEALSRNYWARGLAAADFDGDGDVDIAITINRGQPLLLMNETETDNHSLVVTLSGPPSVCFGAKVEVLLKDVPQTRWWGGDVTFMGMHAAELIFGLGKNTVTDRLQVRWADGKMTTLTNVPSGRVNLAHPDVKPDAR
ncbi:MAG: CRTAC1 family protein [Candidatus Latescibacteria bacterium]|nr:CRTAC1 family protein [Candidatus Latescibacterota bacterium]